MAATSFRPAMGAAYIEPMTDSIFVFGSNLAGRHGKGAALHARLYHGAVIGQGVGPQGQSYAIPTKDARLKTLPLEAIRRYVRDFLDYARQNPSLRFQVTRIGCGLAGYHDEQIAPFFRGAPENCDLPVEWFALVDGGNHGGSVPRIRGAG